MKTRHVVMLVIGCLLLLPGLGLIVGGGAIGVLEATTRDSAGWHSVSIERLASPGVAVTTTDTMVRLDGPSSVVDRLDLEMRLAVTPADGVNPVFVGVAPTAALDRYLSGAARDQVVGVDARGVVTYRAVPGSGSVAPPATESFWAARATGSGTQTLTWTLRSGSWTVAVLNASGVPGVSVSAVAGVRSAAVVPLGVGMVVVGLVLLVVGVVLVVTGVRGRDRARDHDHDEPGSGPGPTPQGRPVVTTGAAGAGPGVGSASSGIDRADAVQPTLAHPVVLEARIARDLSRWLWLVKWFLALPHLVVLVGLWLVFGVTTVCAWFAILVTGRYPRSLFDVNVGVMRWSWRVMHYCGSGGLGTDRYPPFSLDPQPGDDARLDIAYPERLSRGLIFVKWLLLLPHWVVVALIVGTQSHTDGQGVRVGGWPGVLGILVFVAGIVLLVTGTMPRGLFDVVVGLNRWVYRVMAYAALMTDVYPPFRFDAGGSEPPPPLAPPSGPPRGDAVVPPDTVVPPDASTPGEPRPADQPDLWHHTPTG
jgi:hypothetical protein